VAMRLSRRTFLRGAAASAFLAGTHVLGLASRASAAEPARRILVLVNLAGGNDALNTAIPLDDAGAPQRSLYESLRPDLAVPLAALGGLELGRAPGLGTRLALHPSLAGLHGLYGQGRLAVVLGVGLAGSSLSHFEAERAWFSGRDDVVAASGSGWLGRHLDARSGGRPQAVSFGGQVNATFAATRAESLGVSQLARFALPDDPVSDWQDGTERGEALRALLAESRTGSAAAAARAGRLVVDQADFLGGVETAGWGSRLEEDPFPLARELCDVASLIRHDLLRPGAASGFGLYHLRVSGFDTHTRQGRLDEESGQPMLLAALARSLAGFQADLDALGAGSRVVTLVYSEFGRRVAQNASGEDAGTDHGAAGALLLLGDPVVGGLHGALPRLDQLDANGNLAVTTDFRRVYASLIDDWLGGNHARVLPGGPFERLPLIRA
jgi:uncharacterized protein (DUF1501 family)